MQPEPKLLRELVCLERDVFGDGGANEWSLVPFIRHGLVFIAEADGQVVGVVEAFRRAEDEGYYLFGLAVAPHWRGQGIGRQLMLAVIAEVRQLGGQAIYLTVAPDNLPAQRLYRDLGFSKAAYFEDEYGQGEDRDYMCLKLE